MKRNRIAYKNVWEHRYFIMMLKCLKNRSIKNLIKYFGEYATIGKYLQWLQDEGFFTFENNIVRLTSKSETILKQIKQKQK